MSGDPRDVLIKTFRQALSEADREKMTLLLQKGALLAYEERGRSVIAEAVETNNATADLIRWLIEQGANPLVCDEDGTTALSTATQEGNVDMTRVLLEAGADPNEMDDRGFSLLHGVAQWGEAAVAAVLVEFGANVNAETEHGRTPIDTAYIVAWHVYDMSMAAAIETASILEAAGGRHGSTWRGVEIERAEAIASRKW